MECHPSNSSQTITIEFQPAVPRAVPSIYMASGVKRTSEAKKTKEFDFESFKERLGDIIYEFGNWREEDFFSERVLTWADRTYLKICPRGFELNEETMELIVKRITKLIKKKLLDSFNCAPVRNLPISLIKEPVRERLWTWPKEKILDYRICWNIVYPGTPPESPFDYEEMQPETPHLFAKAMNEWAMDFCEEIGHPFPVNEESPQSTIPEGSLELALRKENYSFEEAQLNLMRYIAEAKDANFRVEGRQKEREIKFRSQSFAHFDEETKARFAEEVERVTKMVVEGKAEIEGKIADIKQQSLEKELFLQERIEEERRELKRLEAEMQEKNAQWDVKAQEFHRERHEYLRKNISAMEEVYAKDLECLSAQIEEERKKNADNKAENERNLAIAEAQANERRLASKAELQKELQNIEQTHLKTEGILNSRVEEGLEKNEKLSAKNQELAKDLEKSKKDDRENQKRNQSIIANMEKSHAANVRALNAMIASLRGTVNHLSIQLNAQIATNAHQQDQINHLLAVSAHLQNQANHLEHKANKRWYKKW